MKFLTCICCQFQFLESKLESVKLSISTSHLEKILEIGIGQENCNQYISLFIQTMNQKSICVKYGLYLVSDQGI